MRDRELWLELMKIVHHPGREMSENLARVKEAMDRAPADNLAPDKPALGSRK